MEGGTLSDGAAAAPRCARTTGSSAAAATVEVTLINERLDNIPIFDSTELRRAPKPELLINSR
jgi:hypothetical protein